MAIAALIVAILALLVSVGSFLNARSAHSLERERRRDELQPKLSTELSRDGKSVRLRNDGPVDLSRVKVWLRPADNPNEPIVTALILDGYVSTSQDLPPMPRGAAHGLGLQLPSENRGGTVRLLCECYGAEGDWTALVAFDVPGAPTVVYA